jgi:hypothetical protein
MILNLHFFILLALSIGIILFLIISSFIFRNISSILIIFTSLFISFNFSSSKYGFNEAINKVIYEV